MTLYTKTKTRVVVCTECCHSITVTGTATATVIVDTGSTLLDVGGRGVQVDWRGPPGRAPCNNPRVAQPVAWRATMAWHGTCTLA